ncbi:MAG: ABC transporter permease [Acidobacteria bacterium]|nr:ABC transporter permease [Acidobacteriota bacterium]
MNFSGIRENTKLAMATLVEYKFRAALTILGVFIGVLVIVEMAAVLNGFRQTIVDQMEGFGTRNVYLWRYPFLQSGDLPAAIKNRKPLTYEDAQFIRETAPAVEYVVPGLAYVIMIPGQPPPAPPELKYKDKSMIRPQFMGGFPVGELVMNVRMAQGRYFNDVENEHRANVCVLGFNVVEALFPSEDPIGKQVNCLGQNFTVVGTFAKFKAGPFGSENQDDNDFIIPYWTFRKMLPTIDDNFIVARMREGQMKEGLVQIEQALRIHRGVSPMADNDFEMMTSDSFIKVFDDIIGGVFVVTMFISGIAFLVGGIGVMNIMLVAVTERTREIGIRKAVGAKKADIIWQFLTEAVTLTGLGGGAGLLFGWLIAKGVMALVPSLAMVIPFWAGAFGFIGSVAVGIIFGLWPAVKAANLDPIAALRHE